MGLGEVLGSVSERGRLLEERCLVATLPCWRLKFDSGPTLLFTGVCGVRVTDFAWPGTVLVVLPWAHYLSVSYLVGCPGTNWVVSDCGCLHCMLFSLLCFTLCTPNSAC